MAIASSTCCLNLSSPPPPSASTTKTHNPISWIGNEKWRKQCVVGMACMIVGVQAGDLVGGQSLAIAQDVQSIVESKEKVGSRWSDKRMCPSWNQNSLETIVPENLPRPSAHRRWEQVGLSKNAPPAVKSIVRLGRTSNNCFSM
ncbi:hypothetical protein Tsubulata_012070 [Turnera subulata]|uniref:Uncharacterized protein n=1 Tax=Turnera subulata TaxID=218843 RepID=A0A9Q0FDC0_9ROSI|nr:hypothetical protein Tsubulata_012070 [Turnera subulata]